MTPTTFSPRARELLTSGRTLGVLATVNEDGTPQQVLLWFLVRSSHVVVNGRVGRTWHTNLARDNRFSFIVDRGPEWVSLEGEAGPSDLAQGQEDIAEMARHYLDPEVAARVINNQFATEDRMSFALHPTRVVVHPDDTMRRRRARLD